MISLLSNNVRVGARQPAKRYYNLMLVAVLLSTGASIWGFQHDLTTHTTQLVAAFQADNARALAAGDLPIITSRLNALMASVNWVCITAERNREPFFEQRRGSCGTTFFQRQYPLGVGTNEDLNIRVTLRLPRALEETFVTQLFFHLLCLGLIFWATKMTETERHAEKRRRDEERQREEAQRAQILAALASQVHHDIQSPLSALDSAIQNLAELPERKRIMIRDSVSRIRDIGNNLKRRHSPDPNNKEADNAEPAVHLLSSLVDSLLSEKREEFRSRDGLEISSRFDAGSYGLFARVVAPDLKRALSNLINNAVEAIGAPGHIGINLTSKEGQVLVTIEDNGKGISSAVLAKLGQRGETHGKPGGSGLGIYHARATVESSGGRLDIFSEGVEKGTTVTLRFPAAPAPQWFVERLELLPGGTVVVLDDDTSIHRLWGERLAAIPLRAHGISVVDLYSADAERDWLKKNTQAAESATFLMDFELIGQATTGLSLIKELGISDRAILVTSRFEEQEILTECQRLGVRMIPKPLAAYVPLAIEETSQHPTLGNGTPDAVLLDDQSLVRRNWAQAAEAVGKRLRTFSSAHDILAAAGSLPKDVPIYVDASLDDDGSIDAGKAVAKDLHARGFTNLRMATGHEKEAFADLPFLREIVGKKPPWSSPESGSPLAWRAG